MANIDNESFNKKLYDLLKVRGYKPAPLNAQNQRVQASQDADVIEFTFIKDGKEYGKAWVSIDDAQHLIVYYDSEQENSPDNETPGLDYDDTWVGFLKLLKQWAQRRQLNFELSNKDRLGDDMRQREHYKMKKHLGEGKQLDELSPETVSRYKHIARADAMALGANRRERNMVKHVPDEEARKLEKRRYGGETLADKKLAGTAKVPAKEGVAEGYHPMGKKASYNDAVPNVKIVLQHNRALEEGEQRYRNVAKIYLENAEGERFLAPTTRPGLARVYARHIAEGGVPNDDRWNHIKGLCEEYNKMAGFVRATKNKQFNESVQSLVNEGVNHYNNLRENLNKLTGHRGYNMYFESWTPTLMEDEGSDDISEMFMSSSLDPRIESVMPILSRLHKNVSEAKEVNELSNWVDDLISETLDLAEAPGAATLKHNQSTEEKNLKAFGLAEDEDEMGITWQGSKPRKKLKKDKVEEDESLKSNNPVGIPEGEDKQGEEYKKWRRDNFDDKKTTNDAIKHASSTKTKFGLGRRTDEGDEGHTGEENSMASNNLNKMAKASTKIGKKVKGMGSKDSLEPWQQQLVSTAADKVDAVYHSIDDEEVEEGLDANQKRAGQLGPTGGPAKVGDLVGANESTEFTDELSRIIDIARFNR
jgi:hypothetical protein